MATQEDMEIVYGSKEPSTEKGPFWGEFIPKLTCYFLGLSIFIGPLMYISMLFVPMLWPLFMLYTFWYFYDRDTPHTGGRKLSGVRKWKIWEYSRDYFPIRMVKTAEIPPDRNYLFAAFPHGVLCYGVGHNIITEANDFGKAFPGLDPYFITLNGSFNFPITRELTLSLGGCASSERSILNVLKGPPGRVCVLIVGGVAEALKSYPGTYNLVLKNRKGFVRVALKSGASLVPVFSFGETSTFTQPSTKFYTYLQKALRTKFGYPFVLFMGRGFFQDLFGIFPFQQPITTIIGKPITLPKVEDPSEELVKEYHQKFITELQKLFDRFKGKYDAKGEEAQIILE